jgi:DNA-binding transcriptional LysR family regulator
MTVMFTQHGLPVPTNIVETVSLPVITSLLQQSTMVAALPEEWAQCAAKAGELSVLVRNLPLGMGAFGIVTRREQKLAPGAQLLLETLRELAVRSGPVQTAPRLQLVETAADA